MKKPVIMWAVLNKRGEITLAAPRRIDVTGTAEILSGQSWETLRKEHGCRVAKVEVGEMEQ